MRVAVGVGVRVRVGVAVEVCVRVAVRVGVIVGVRVRVGVGVRDLVAVGEGVRVAVAVGVGVEKSRVAVGVGVRTDVGVAVAGGVPSLRVRYIRGRNVPPMTCWLAGTRFQADGPHAGAISLAVNRGSLTSRRGSEPNGGAASGSTRAAKERLTAWLALTVPRDHRTCPG